MNNKPRLFGFFLPIFIIFTSVAVALRSIAAVNYIDEYGYYTEKLLFYISAAIAALGVLIFIGYIFFEKSNIKLIPSFDSPASYAPSAVVAVALILLGVNLLKESSDINPLIPLLKPIAIISGILAILSALYFALSTVMIRRRSMKRADLGLVALLFICFYIAYLYFDKSLPINAPNKTVDEMAYLGAALFFLYETRLSLGREKWRCYIAFGFVAALLLAYSSIPSLVVYFVNGRVISNSIYESALSFALFLFATFKILLTTVLVEDVESPVVTKIIAASKKRTDEITKVFAEDEQSALAQDEQDDNNQISITDISYDSDDTADEDKISQYTAEAIENMSFTEDTSLPEAFTESDDGEEIVKAETPNAEEKALEAE